ncbi:MAG: metallophosphoesterase [Bacteroides sp.]|jgi:hypothetical protein|nr:metallophosphoesterase [Bacteroides sp.]
MIDMIRWLHLSDLHLGSTDMSTDMMRDELPEFLTREGLKCDYVFCTGDIKTAGPKDCGFTDDMAIYIKEICQVVGISSDRLFIVPGNHDVNRDLDERKSSIEKLMFHRQGYYDPAKGIIDSADLVNIMKGETDFKDFLLKIFKPDRVAMYGNPDRPHFVIETPDFNILHVDTTISYTKDQEANDLIVGTHALYKEINKVNKNKPTILLTHYPITSLLQDERKYISSILQKNEIRLWLAGHEHDHVAQPIHYLHQLQAGELRYENKANATFLIGEYDHISGKVQVTAYTWFPEGWAQYPILDLDNKKRDRYECLLLTVQDGGLSRTTKVAKDANKQYFYRLPEKVEQGLLPSIDDDGNITSFEQLLETTWDSNTHHIIILADGGMGKTTMLLEYCRKSSEPILYVPVERLVALKIGIEDYCARFIYDNDIHTFRENLQNRYSKPTLTLFIDGLNEVDGKHERSFVLEIQRLNMLKGLRIVVTSRSNFTLRYSMPGYRSTKLKPLEDTQIYSYFNDIEWARIKGTRALHQLLGNPMMVTIYKEICSVAAEFMDVEFLDWRFPVKNSTDLFHNYYVAQMALMMKRSGTDGERMLLTKMCISCILPAIAYKYERKRRLNYSLSEFRTLFNEVLQNIIVDNDKLLPIQEHYREEKMPELNVTKIMDFLTQDMRLLHRDNTIMAFPHQIYRDYLSAQWIIRQSQIKDNIMELWNSRKIPYSVMTHIRWGSGEYWKNGIACNVHKAGMGIIEDRSHFLVDNLFSCFPGTASSGTPDYSKLWLKGHRLPDNPIGDEKIDLSESEIDKTTVGLSSDDVVLYTNLCLSEGRDFLAAIAVKERERQIQLNIFSLDNGMMVFNHELNKKVGKMEFHGNRLFIVASSIYVFSMEDDKQWHYSGVIGDGGMNIFHKLQKCIIADHILYLYYNGRLLVRYDLRDCHKMDTIDGKQWENLIEGENVTSLRRTTPWTANNSPRQKDILSKVGNDSFQAISYGDGRLIVESEGEQQYELSRGAILLMDAAISSDGRSAATLGFHSVGTKRKIQLWDLDNEKRVADFACPSIVKNIHLSENGKWLMGETDDSTWVLNSESRNEIWYGEHFVSNHTGKLITYGDKVIRKKENDLYLFDLKSGNEEWLESPTPNPSMVCFLPDRTLAAVDKKGQTLHLWSTRDGNLLSQYMDGSTILSIQPIQSKPFIAVFTNDQKIRIYHTGVRKQYDKMQCLIKEAGETNAKQMVAHQERPLIACTDGRRYLETRFFKEWTSGGKDKGLWEQNKFRGNRHIIDGDILDIAFNLYNQQIVAILSNGKIMYCSDTHCKYIDSFNIIAAFNVDSYDFSRCSCSNDLRISLTRNGTYCKPS